MPQTPPVLDFDQPNPPLNPREPLIKHSSVNFAKAEIHVL